MTIATTILRHKLELNHNISQKNISEIKSKTSPIDSVDIPELAISLTPIGLIFSWVIFFIMLRKIRNILEDKMLMAIKGSHRLPCHKCKFYANNHYLKCAVNPSIVMTEEAKNCAEYSPEKDNKLSHKNIFH